jgi:hypothetical protein
MNVVIRMKRPCIRTAPQVELPGADIWKRNEDQPVVAQNPAHLAHEIRRVCDVFEHVVHRDQIEGCGRKSDIAQWRGVNVKPCFARDANGALSEFNAGDLPAPLFCNCQFRSNGASDVEQRATIRDGVQKPFGPSSEKISLLKLVLCISCRILYGSTQNRSGRNRIHVEETAVTAADDPMFRLANKRAILRTAASVA